MKTLILILGLLLVPVATYAESNFAPVNLPRGVQLKIPKGCSQFCLRFHRLLVYLAS